MKKLKPRKTVIKNLDKIFSQYIRLRDCRRTTQTDDQGLCITCGKLVHYKQAHCGHFHTRGAMNLRWDERNAHLQCCGCNTYRAGEQAKHALAIESMYDREVLDELMQLERDWKAGNAKVGTGDLRELLEYWKLKLKQLKET
jgi:hypothetical protein